MNILKSLFALLLVTASATASAERVLVSKSWMTDCKQDVEGKTRCELINNKTSLTSERKLSVVRDDTSDFMLVILSKKALGIKLPAAIAVTIKVDSNETISTTGMAISRDDGYTQVEANFIRMDEILEQMKRGNQINTRFYSKETKKEVQDTFSLSGFTKNLKKALSLDKRRTKSETKKLAKSKPSSRKSGDAKIVGQWMENQGAAIKVTIYKEGSQFLRKMGGSDSSELTSKLFTKKVRGVTRFYDDIDSYEIGQFYTISSNGYLQYWGASGNYYDAKPYTKKFSDQSLQDDLKAATEDFLRDALGKELPDDMMGTFGDQETLEGTSGQHWVAYLPKAGISFVSEKGSRKVIFVGQSRASAIRFMKENY